MPGKIPHEVGAGKLRVESARESRFEKLEVLPRSETRSATEKVRDACELLLAAHDLLSQLERVTLIDDVP